MSIDDVSAEVVNSSNVRNFVSHVKSQSQFYMFITKDMLKYI